MIPKNIDLKLDRDVPYNQPKSKIEKSPDRREEYGKDLSANIERMKAEAPFKEKRS